MNFSIFRESDNSEVAITDAFDKEMCDACDLEYNHINEIGDCDYGHFYFLECKKDQDFLFDDQTSISWVGLLNVIVYYSCLPTGKVTKYDLMSALTWCMDHSVKFPESSRLLLARLLDFIERKKYYIRIQGHARKQFYLTGYTNSYDKSRIIENNTGLFLVDDKVCLKGFYPYVDNINMMEGHKKFSHKGILIDNLKIPSEINDIDNTCMLKLGCNIAGICHLIISEKIVINNVLCLKKYYESITNNSNHKVKLSYGDCQLFPILNKFTDNKDIIDFIIKNAKEFMSHIWGFNIMEICLT